MKFGIALLPVFALETSPSEILDAILLQVRTARESGFNSIWAAHHYLTDSGQIFQSLPLLARAAAEGPGMTFGTSVFLLPYSHPVEVAEQTATLDIITGGSLIFGVGLGYRAEEFRAFGITKRQGVERLVESIEVLKLLWTSDHINYQGKHFQLTDATINPKPLQKPRPPIWVGADSEHGVRRAAEISDSWLISPRHSLPFIKSLAKIYYERRLQLKKPLDALPIFRELHVAQDRDTAVNEVRRFVEDMYHTYARWKQPGERYDLSFDELKGERYIIGSPEDCIEDIERIRREIKVNLMFFRIYWPGMDPAYAIKTIKLFGEKVIPYFKD